LRAGAHAVTSVEVTAAAEVKSHLCAAALVDDSDAIALAYARNPDPWLRLYVIMFALLDSLLNFLS
jgi:hypothetical protein